LCQFFSIDKYDICVDPRDIFLGIFGKIGRCDKEPFLRPMACQGADKFLDFGPTDRIFPPLGLNIDGVKA
jgi:hypothetical protein